MSEIAYDRVKLARSNHRPTGLSYLQGLCHDFIELHGDRAFGDDPAMIGGIGRLGGIPITVLAMEKGHTARERIRRNFGASHPEGYRKTLRLMKQAEKFHRPVLCLVDTSGAFCGIGAEERGEGQAIAENLFEMSTLQTPILSLFIGEGGSGGALALAVADQVWMLENSIYSVISPEGCASILWKDAKRAPDAAQCLKLTAPDALASGVADQVLPEADLGTPAFYARLEAQLVREFRRLLALSPEELLAQRYQRFRRLGVPQ